MTRGSAARSFTAGTELFAVENRNSGVRGFGPSTIPCGAVLSPAQIRGARRVPGPGLTERSPERGVPSGRGRRERAEMNGAAFRSCAFPFPSERRSRRGRGEKYFSESQPRGIPFPGAARLGLPTPGSPHAFRGRNLRAPLQRSGDTWLLLPFLRTRGLHSGSRSAAVPLTRAPTPAGPRAAPGRSRRSLRRGSAAPGPTCGSGRTRGGCARGSPVGARPSARPRSPLFWGSLAKARAFPLSILISLNPTFQPSSVTI